MTDYTTSYALPYPLGEDRVAVAADIKALADKAAVELGGAESRAADDLEAQKVYAEGRYLAKTTATTYYLTKADAGTTYLAQTTAEADYLTKATAGTYYLTKSDAGTTYLTQASAETQYGGLPERMDTVEAKQATLCVRDEAGEWVWDTTTGTHYIITDHTGAPIVRATPWPVPDPSTPQLNW